MFLVLMTVAHAEPCAPVVVEAASVDLAGATAVVVRGVAGAVEIQGSEGNQIVAKGTACRALKVKLARKGNVIEATVKGARGEDLKLELTVPTALPGLSFQDQLGPVTVTNVEANVAVVSSEGPVEVHGAKSMRVAYVTGPVVADRIAGDLVVDVVTGTVSASAIRGNVLVDGVTGPVTVEDVDGSLAVSGGSGPVNQNNVRGGVQLP